MAEGARSSVPDDGGEARFERLCQRHPGLAEELRRLRLVWSRGRDPSEELPVSVRVGRLVGRDVDSRVALNGGRDPLPHDGPGQAGIGRIGRYRLEDEVARGGQGAILRVYDQDLRRPLAMKVVLGGEAGGQAAPVASVAPRTLGRFLEEAQVTAQLDHPGIVPVHELGLDPDGRVYFTMRLVRGEDLAAIFAKTREGVEGWSQTRALNVLVRVCEAMAYAHHKGVIHRDLKPANVMVGRFGEVYVMDWGLARVLARDGDSADTEDLAHDEIVDPDDPDVLTTMDGDVVGTPAYMPPEQALGRLAAMGPQSDVYSLGAMLYELLAGHEPYASGDRLSVLDVLYKAQSEAPEPLSSEAPGAPQELVAICEKAMARDPARRYPDMSGLAEDLRAFLEGRVVRAYETGAVAEFRKWVVRNKPLAGAMAAGVLALVAGLATTLVQKGRADENARLALEREHAAIQAEARASAEALRASHEAETARRTTDFLVGLFEVVDPGESRGNTITAREILDRGAQRIDSELGDQPEVQSALMGTMGTVYRSLGLYAQATPLLERSLERRIEAFGDQDPRVAEALTDLGHVQRLAADFAEAEPLLRRALEQRIALSGERGPAVASVQHELGVVLGGLNRFAEGETFLRSALAIRREALGRDPAVAETLNALAFNLFDQGDPAAAEPLLRESLEIRQETLGEHPATAEGLNDLGVFLFEQGEPEEAEELLHRALEMKRRIYAEVHPEVATSLNNLAVAYHTRGDLAGAETYYLEALDIQRQLLGPAHPDIAQAMHNVAILRQNQGDWDGARELFIESLDMYREVLGDDHPSLARPLQNTLEFLGERIEHVRESDPEPVQLALELLDLADVLLLVRNREDALDRAYEAMELLEGDPSTEPWMQARAESVLAAAWGAEASAEDPGRGEAEEALRHGLATLDAARGPDSREARETARRLLALIEQTADGTGSDEIASLQTRLARPSPSTRTR